MKKVTYLAIFLCVFITITNAENYGWSTPLNISNNTPNSYDPDMKIDANGYIHIVWENPMPTQVDVFYSNSTDGGVTWSTPVNASNNTPHSRDPDLEIDNNGNLHLVWQDNPSDADIYYSNSSDRGATWSTPVDISNDAVHSNDPDLEIDANGNLHVVWDNNPAQRDVLYSNSSNNGATWSTPINVSDNSGNSIYPDLEISDNGNFYLVWYDDTPNSGQWDIFYSNSSDNGATWITPVNVSNSTTTSWLPDLEIDSNRNIYIVWYEALPGNEIFYINSSDCGSTWSTIVNISRNSGDSQEPDLEIDSSRVFHIIWSDSTLGEGDIFYSSSYDAGATWVTPMSVSNSSGTAEQPELEVYSNTVLYAAWTDDFPGQNEIYFSKGVPLPAATHVAIVEGLTFIYVILVFIFALLFFTLKNLKPRRARK